MTHTVKGAWIDRRGRRHNFTMQSDTTDRSIIKEMIQAQYPCDYNKPGQGVVINAVMADQDAAAARSEAHELKVAEQHARWEQSAREDREKYGKATSGTISGGQTINGNNYSTASDGFERNAAVDAAGDALIGLTGAAIGFTARGLWAGAKGLNNLAKEAEEEQKIEEAAIKAKGKEAWDEYQKKQVQQQRIFWHLGLGSVSCMIPGLGLVIYMLGLGPYWGNKAGDAICNKSGIKNKFAKYAIIGALMVPVGIPVGAMTHMAITSMLGIHPTGQTQSN